MMNPRLEAMSKLSGVFPSHAPSVAFLAITLLTPLKPRLKGLLRPVAKNLVEAGVTANQATLVSLAGSIIVGAALYLWPTQTSLFALLPLWLPVRMACAAIDGTMAVEFGQKSRLGGVLNEVGDIASDVALFLSLAFVAPFSPATVFALIALIVLSEVAGVLGPILGSDRRLEGPLGKVDRSVILAALGTIVAIFSYLSQIMLLVMPLLYVGLIITIWNRLRFALADPCNSGSAE
jgi:CDP-diacylglycerol--glycerol-3-phosphate 3-phosphatidyltransferase